MDSIDVIQLKGAEGVLEPSGNETRLDELIQDVGEGKLFVATSGEVPYRCSDSRLSDSEQQPGPMSVAGTVGLAVSDDLTTRAFIADDTSIAGSLQNIINDFKGRNLPFGNHDDDNPHEDGTSSGCITVDKLPIIYNLMIRKAPLVKSHVEFILGSGAVNAELEERILRNANQRTRFSTGQDIKDTFMRNPESKFARLTGQSKAVIMVVNWRDGLTLDKQAVLNKYGADYQVLNYDIWSCVKAAEKLGRNSQEMGAIIISLTYFNVASAMAIVGPGMKLIVAK